jgi:hypothetical protein
MIIGYARVSTDGQTLDAQQSALLNAGADRVFAEKISGTVTDRKALGKAIGALGEGDVLLVTRLDRLARSTRRRHCSDQIAVPRYCNGQPSGAPITSTKARQSAPRGSVGWAAMRQAIVISISGGRHSN